MRIDIWSDVVCPWCYIGKRRLEQALAALPAGESAEIVYHSFLLDPGAPQVPTATVAEHLGTKYGGGAGAGRRMVDQVEAVAAEEGLLFRLADAQHASTVDAHRLLHLALAEGGPQVQVALKEALLAAYFLRAENPADPDVLTAAAVAVGLDEARVREVLAGTAFTEEVYADVDRALDLGATGVPFFVIDNAYAVAGAQPVEVFHRVLERARAEVTPLVHVTSGGDTCGPDGCPT